MQKFLTDVHTHSDFSFDGKSTLKEMIEGALEKGLCFYGVSEHFDYDAVYLGGETGILTDAEEYFHAARHLQEDYAGVINVLVGAEFGFTDDKRCEAEYLQTQAQHRPDFVVNSVHALRGKDYCHKSPYYEVDENGEKKLRSKAEVYAEYFKWVRKSLDAAYDYDIVGHVGYVTRYAPYEDKSISYAEYANELDDIFKTIIQKGKILEINASRGFDGVLPTREMLERYYALGGRKVSYGSDAHGVARLATDREKVMEMLKEIGFTHVTVPCKGEFVAVEI